MESANSIDTYFVLVFGTAGMLLLTTAVVMFVYMYQRKLIKRKMAFQEVEDLLKKQELKTAYALLEGQDKERSRIAQELHDNISSTLVTLKMYLNSAEKKSMTVEQSKLFQRINEIAHKAEDDTRKLSHSLDSGSLKHFGLSVAISDLADAVNQTDRCEFEFHNHLLHAVTGKVAMNVYRIIQELVNNTLKHADASRVTLEVTEIEGEYLNIIFEDNGKGFDPDMAAKGIGMKNIYSRIDQLSGKINFDTNHPGRTTIILEIPLS